MMLAIRRFHGAHVLALALGALFSTSSPAQAAVRACLQDNAGAPLRFVWVQHWFTDKMTDGDGCVSFDADGAIDIRVFAHNPVVRMDDGKNWTLPVSQEMKGMRDGDTRRLTGQSVFWRIAEHFRDAYNNGLREFSPWNDAKFPAGNRREPSFDDYTVNRGVIRATWPDQSPALYAWVEGAAVATAGTSVFVGFPLVHLKQGDEADHTTIAHELGHALHFSRISNGLRMGLEISYGLFLAADPDKAHCFDKRTDKTVAWIEAFGIFAAEFEASPGTGASKHANFFDRVAGMRGQLLDGESCGTTLDRNAMFGPDVEGAVFLTLFHDFARDPAVGLPAVVESYVSCGSMDIEGYAACVKHAVGADSDVYRALLRAAGCHGIQLDGPQPVAGLAEAGDRFGTSAAFGDFNGDGIQDLAIGSPRQAIGSAGAAGMVNILYGLPSTLTTQCNQTFTQTTLDVLDGAEEDDRFGEALAAGDFDGDGFTDLAVSAPGENLGATVAAGGVAVIRGSIRGLTADDADEWSENRFTFTTSAAPESESVDYLGLHMAAGDFNGDQAADLAMSVTGEDIDGLFDVGAVLVIYGQEDLGLQPSASELLTQPEVREQWDRFGSSLAVGNFNGDAYDDLAVGATGEKVGTQSSAGAVSLFYGSPARLAGGARRHFTLDSPGIVGVAGTGDKLGASLAAGDFDDDDADYFDDRDDLAIGVPGKAVGGVAMAGAVVVLYAPLPGTSTPRSEMWTEEALSGQFAPGDGFGQSLAAGDFDGDGRGDLAVGIPNRAVGSAADAGAVRVLYGAPVHTETGATGPNGVPILVAVPAGLSDDRSRLWSQNSAGISDVSEANDHFGSCLAAGYVGPEGRVDLVIGVPFEDVGPVEDAGALAVIRGSSTGLSATGNQFWHQDQ